VNIILFNNRIYGLTKGQFSPTSEMGKNTKSSPWGNIDAPLNPIAVALGANATFVARTVDRDPKHMIETFKAAYDHDGVSFVEVLQNCNIFNDGAFEDITDKDVKDDAQLRLIEGAPLMFGSEGNKGIRLNASGSPEVVTVGENGVVEDDLLKHDPNQVSPAYASLLAHLDLPEFPVPFGILRRVSGTPYDKHMTAQIANAKLTAGAGSLENLIRGNETWTID
jgi:2-oxoglutarate ferredoxin oxidoreductase subunit beta